MTQPEMESFRYSPPARALRMTRRRFLKISVGAGIAAFVGVVAFQNLNKSSHACGEYELDCIANDLTSGGPPRDGIPSIDSPRFISGAEAENNAWISDTSIVDAVETSDGGKAYPRSITVWHEIVNDTLDGIPASLTFCPLTGSSIFYKGKAADGSRLKFGTTGLLYNSNLVMYDRQTNSMYPQILGLGISGPNKGVDLDSIPVSTTSWKSWKQAHPDSQVLSRRTGIYSASRYDIGPYGDYDTNGSIFFPVANHSTRFFPKKPIIGSRIGHESVAILKDEFRTSVVANFALSNKNIVAMYDSSTDYIRLYSRDISIKGSVSTFTLSNGQIIDTNSGSVWSPLGLAISGPSTGTQLQQVSALQVMWFGWYAFHPSASLVP